MNETETKIVAKFHDEILAAVSSERNAIVNDLYSFLGVVEKRIALTTIELKPIATSGLAQALGGSAYGGLSQAFSSMKNEAEKLGGEIKSAI